MSRRAVEQLVTSAHRGFEATLGVDHPYTIYALGDLGLMRRDLGDYKVAAQNCQKAWELARRVLTDEHPATLTCGAAIGVLRRKRGSSPSPSRAVARRSPTDVRR